jgi:hypothetical protein
VHRNRGGQQQQILRVLACIPRQPHCIYWHRFRGACWAQISWERKSIQSVRTCTEIEGHTVQKFGHIFRGGWHEFQGIFLLVIPYSLCRNFGTNFETVRTTFIAGTTVQCTDFWDRNRGAFPDSSEGVFAEEEG